jgi:acetyl-CoA carboxylase biotin carboxyl carrier protein
MSKEKKSAGSAGESGVDLKELQRLTAFMTEHGLEELEYQRGSVHVRLRKAGQANPGHAAQAVVDSLLPTPAAAQTPGKRVSEASGAAQAEPESLHIVKSPIVGTFYEAASPGAEPFVAIGDKVKVGQVLCVIEAMKLMNEIEADCAGEIVRRLVENGQPVEYGQPLFALRPSVGE